MAGHINKEIESGRYYRTAWTTTPADYNCVTSDPGKTIRYGEATGRVAKAVVVGTSGTLVVTGLDGTNVTLPAMPSGFRWDLQIAALVASGTTAQNVVVIW